VALEIERKYLVLDDSWRAQAEDSITMRQAYMQGSELSSVRVRLSGDKAHLNIKSATLGVSRLEFDYEIPIDDANEMLDKICEQPVIEKTRYHVPYKGHLWEVDVFNGENEGLVVAEIELKAEDEQFEMPSWVGKEVSDDPRYYNVCLVKNPYRLWKE
jgi:adenylate cyclase